MTKNPTRFAKRMGNRMAKAVGQANKKLNKRFYYGMGVRETAQFAAAGQFRHFTSQLVANAKREEIAERGPDLTHSQGMLRRKAIRAGTYDGI